MHRRLQHPVYDSKPVDSANARPNNLGPDHSSGVFLLFRERPNDTKLWCATRAADLRLFAKWTGSTRAGIWDRSRREYPKSSGWPKRVSKLDQIASHESSEVTHNQFGFSFTNQDFLTKNNFAHSSRCERQKTQRFFAVCCFLGGQRRRVEVRLGQKRNLFRMTAMDFCQRSIDEFVHLILATDRVENANRVTITLLDRTR